MKRLDAWLLHIALLLVGGTGLVYGWMRYFATSHDPFAVVNHPLQPLLHHLHIWFAPLLVLVLGHVFYSHAWLMWRGKVMEGRRSGITLMLGAGPMIFSGYFVQTSVSSTWRTVWIVVHCASSLVWMGGYLAHVLIHWQARRRAVPA